MQRIEKLIVNSEISMTSGHGKIFLLYLNIEDNLKRHFDLKHINDAKSLSMETF